MTIRWRINRPLFSKVEMMIGLWMVVLGAYLFLDLTSRQPEIGDYADMYLTGGLMISSVGAFVFAAGLLSLYLRATKLVAIQGTLLLAGLAFFFAGGFRVLLKVLVL